MLAVAAQNKNTVVVVHSVGPLILEPWIDHPNVTAVRTLIVVRYMSSELTIVRSFGQVYQARKQEMPSQTFCMASGTHLESFRTQLRNRYRTTLLSS